MTPGREPVRLSQTDHERLLRKLKVSFDEFEIEVRAGPRPAAPTERWVIQVRLGPHSVILRELKRGKIQIDGGGRGSGGRRSTGTDCPATAVARAKEVLFAARAEELLDTSIETDQERSIRVGDIKSLIQRTRLPQMSSWDRYERCIKVAEHVWGSNRPLRTIDEHAVEEGMVKRMKGLSGLDLNPVKAITALKTFKDFYTAVSHVARLRGRNHEKLMPTHPMAGMKWPSTVRINRGKGWVKESVRSQPRFPFSLGFVRLLLSPFERTNERGEIEVLPAPVDAADPTGVLRLVIVLLAFTGRRVNSVLHMRIEDIVTKASSIHDVLEESKVIDSNDAGRFSLGLLNMRAEFDKQSYQQPIPIGKVVHEELTLYLERAEVTSIWLFPAPKKPNTPIPYQTLFKSDWVSPTGALKAGRLSRAIAIAKEYLSSVGRDPAEIIPDRKGDGPHRLRSTWANLMEKLGYGNLALSVGPDTADLPNHIAYFGGWKMSEEDVRQSSYVALDPDVLLGIANLRRAEEVVQPREHDAADQVLATVEGMSKARSLRRPEQNE